MKLDPRQIPAEGCHLEGELPPDSIPLESPSAKLLAPVRYSLDVAPGDAGFTAFGHLETTVELECVATLDRFPHPVEIPAFVAEIPGDATQPVDLTPLIREDILLALPAYPRKPGIDFIHRSAESKQANEQTEAPEKGWKALDDLNLNE